MKFSEVVVQTLAWLQREGRVSYRALRLEFDLTEDVLDALKEELIEVKELAVDKDGKMLVWAGTANKTEPEKRGTGETETSKTKVVSSQLPVTSPQPLAPSTQPPAERRQLTVMFCDLVGSTALSEQLDPEELREVVRAYQETCASVIGRYEGHIAQHLGDGLLVYFGYPIAHEDDAQRAVRAGLGIVTALQKWVPSFLVVQASSLHTARMAAPPERQGEGVVGATSRSPLQVRIGIHTGLVVVGEMGTGGKREQLALGDTPNVAARLQGLAAPDAVVISAATHRFFEGLFDCRDLGAHPVKGVSTPLQVYQVVGESEVRSRLEAAATKGLTPLVGREEELGLLRKRWEQSKAGTGQVVLLSGEAGIGKSRLVQILKEQVAHEKSVRIEYRCSPYHQNSAFYPIIEHLHRLLQFAPHDTPQAKLSKLQQTLAQYRFPQADTLPLLAALLSLPHPEGAPPITLSPQKQKQKTQEALVAWIIEEAEKAAVYSAWEDLHWADPSTLEVLALFLDQVPTTRLLVLLTFRPEFTPPWGNRSHFSQITLSRLGRSQVEAMVEKVTGGKALPSEVVQQIVAKTDGVPLFVEELTKMVLESVESLGSIGFVESLESGSTLGQSSLQLGIPATLQDALMARIDRLGATKELAQLGATIGREFSYELLQAVSLLDEGMLQQGLKQLVEAELIYQRGLPPQAVYLFKHALVQDTAYQSLLKSRRQQLHQQVARILEERFPDLQETQPELLAYHYTEAGLIAQALPYWRQAGQRAIERSANAEAIAHLTKGLDLLKILPDTPERLQQELVFQTTLGPVLMAAKGFAAPEVERAYARALELCRQMGETPRLFHVLQGLEVFYYVRGKLQTARELGEQSLSLAQRSQDPARLLQAHCVLGCTVYQLGEFALAREHLEQGIALDDPQKSRFQDPGVTCLSYVALTLWQLGYPEQALKRSREALALAQGRSHPFSLALALAWAAWLHQLRREGRAAQERAEAAIAVSTEHGFPFWLAMGTILRGWALAEQGEEEGISQMRQSLAAWQAMGAEGAQSYFLALLAEAHGKTGQIEEGLSVLAGALAVVEKTEEGCYGAELYRLKGELVLQSAVHSSQSKQVSDKSQAGQNMSEVSTPYPPTPNPQTEAEACFHKAIEIARKQQAKSLELRAVMSLSRLWQQQGKQAEARQMLADIYSWFTEGFDTKDLQEAKALLDEL